MCVYVHVCDGVWLVQVFSKQKLGMPSDVPPRKLGAIW